MALNLLLALLLPALAGPYAFMLIGGLLGGHIWGPYLADICLASHHSLSVIRRPDTWFSSAPSCCLRLSMAADRVQSEAITELNLLGRQDVSFQESGGGVLAQSLPARLQPYQNVTVERMRCRMNDAQL